ncbi:MAG: OPT/YSL family transporter [Phycisphaerales bacterium]|nr:OPT/YSL family transporter [Phycisphaerales bacterium]MCB9841333.1 OPT/YSL family transporter [Phycisphaeraceae bacterium]
MAIPHLTDEQVRTWSREQKDTWWLENVWRGDMPQLTLRSGLTGFFLGGILSATNLYVGAKSGWTLGVGLTSVILAFAFFRVLGRLGAKDMTILENNCSQSIATAAGYMTGPLISGMAAYMWVSNSIMPWWQMMAFNVVLSLMGVLVAFPMKRRFINEEHQPFPEGRACGVVLDTLYTSAAKVGMFKAKTLAIAAGATAFIAYISGDACMRLLRALTMWPGKGGSWTSFLTQNKDELTSTWHLPHNLIPFYNWLGENEPKLAGVPFRQLGLTPALDLAMMGAGGLLGIRGAISMMIGMIINFFILVPWMISEQEVRPLAGSYAAGDAVFSRASVVNNWALWWGIAIMVSASMVSLFAKPKIFVEAFRVITGKGRQKAGPEARTDVLGHIELPLWISWVGVPAIGAIGVVLANLWFGVPVIYGALAIPLIVLLTVIAVSSTALTSITPTGSLSKIPQFIFGAAHPNHPPTNLMTAVMCTEVASNASNLLMDIKPGYMLGAKPRQQAIGHCIGIVAGALASTPLFYLLFLSKRQEGESIQDAMITDEFGFPSALQWRGVSDLMQELFGGSTAQSLLSTSIVVSMIVAAVVGVLFEVIRVRTKNKFPLSPLAIGLGVVIPPESTLAMFVGAAFFWITHKMFEKKPESTGNLLWIQTHEPICAGVIAGAALVGILNILLGIFVLAPLG